MPTVVIPAYNEGKGIARCLRAVLADGVDDLTVVVIPNACRDDTATQARAVEVPSNAQILIVETQEGGKTNAINLGERALRDAGLDTYPRLFLDGDIELAAGTLRALFAEASRSGARVVAAQPKFETSRSDLLVRLYYAADCFNPYHLTTAPNGSGTYCVSREGRARWGEFPNIIADDSYVERQFTRAERITALGFFAIVRVPRTYRALRAISARKRVGNQELDQLVPLRKDQHDATGTFGSVGRACLCRPWLLPAFAVWAMTKWLERLERGKVAKMQGMERWQQDTTSRD
ncbi:MAG: glycosyltransferase [Limnohabitans sp.]|nr:glycosyltransferase [Limnohabitans sp.]